MTAAITSRDGMQQAIEQLARLYEGLASLRREFEAANPTRPWPRDTWTRSAGCSASSTSTPGQSP
jgi:hypothetical protein